MDFWDQDIELDNSDLHPLSDHQPLPPFDSSIPSSHNNPAPSSPLPTLAPCSSTRPSRSTIPGPAGVIQAAMHRRTAAAAMDQTSSATLGTLSDFIEVVEEEEGDFTLNPWLSAMAFPGLSSPSPIGSFNNRKSTTDRIPQVVGVVKSCTPNGLGDLMITLKDKTGTIEASIHRNVLTTNGDISVGCVLILQKVVVFRPSPRSCYLNITPTNVLQIFRTGDDISQGSSVRDTVCATTRTPGVSLAWTDEEVSQLQFDDVY